MIAFRWHGIDTTASIYYGRWVHGLPEVIAMLTEIADPSENAHEALKTAAERLGGSVLSDIPTGDTAHGSA